MNDPSSASPIVATAATVGGVLADLAALAGRLPSLRNGEAGREAKLLDRLAGELAEAAAALRGAPGEHPGAMS